ncbi:hypothetical protein BGZ83_002332 [Gryganskiella cystojenkinii]|nr:hypothetical protein BGZ83_002332 [Gryganskiella cystojenkinii]
MATPLSPVLNCTEFVAAEGRYELLQDIYLDQVLPHPVIPTHVSSVSVKYKDYYSNANNGAASSKGGAHGKQNSADSQLSASNIDRLEERLRDFKLTDERNGNEDENTSNGAGRLLSGSGGTLSRNFHGNLVDLPPYNDESNGTNSGYKSPRSGMMSPGLPQVMTPGPPPLKDSTSANRLSDPYSQFGPPPPSRPPPPQQQQPQSSSTSSQFAQGFKSLSRANSHYNQQQQQGLQQDENGGASLSTSVSGSSAGLSAFFGGKRKKPKNNIAKTNSTFVAKITTHENLAKILANRVHEDVYLFWNTGRTFTWSDLGQKPNEPLSHISFTKAFPTSHDVNVVTRSCDHLDVIIGFSTGDIIWFDPLCNKYYRLNKQLIIKDSPVTMIKWIPGSETQFMAAFQDGSILIMDKERDDNTFSAPTPSNDTSFNVTRPKHGKHNPISHWQVSKKPITAFAFSPDLQHVAVVSNDGYLRIIDFQQERLLDTFSAYFGSLNCVCWSPDGKYVLTGGQDDLVTIWSFKDQRIIARCQGHQSYVTGVAFDPWRCDERNYRFGSVGEDAKLLLWDFSVGALHKPKAAVMQRRGSNATVLGMAATGSGVPPGSGGSGGGRPGHGSKGSISSLRGIGGHSLFSGHHTKTSQVPSSGSSTNLHHQHQHQHHPTPPVIAEEQEQQQQQQQQLPSLGTEDISSISSSSRNSAVQQESGYLGPETVSFGGEGSSSASSVHSSTVVAESVAGTAASTISANDAGSSSGQVYKKSGHARTLPHLHLHKMHSTGSEQSTNEHNSSSGSSSNASGHQGHGHGHAHHQHHGFSSLFRHGHGSQNPQGGVQTIRPPEPRSHVAMLQPLMAKGIHHEPLASITFREDAIMTSDRRGHIKVWKRPPPLPHHP